MFRTLSRGVLRIVFWLLALVGLAALVLIAMIAQPLKQPPPIDSIATTARAVDRSDMPGLQYFAARDGTSLAFRHYPARGAAADSVVILIHGSSGSSAAVHALGRALAERGVETYAPDIRGHGGSGTRGDIGYGGQLQDDLADLAAMVRRSQPSAPLILMGHSAGGGFALRMAGSPVQDLFARVVMLAPYLGYKETTNRPNGGGWAAPDYPRIIGLTVLRAMKINCCDALPVVAFAVPPQSTAMLASHYSFRLLTDFGPGADFRTSLAATTRPIELFAGADDELMQSDNYQATLGAKVKVTILPGVNHMGIVSDTAAVSRIADEMVRPGVRS